MKQFNDNRPHQKYLDIPAPPDKETQKQDDITGRGQVKQLPKPPNLPKNMNAAREQCKQMVAENRTLTVKKVTGGLASNYAMPKEADDLTLEGMIKRDAYLHTEKGRREGKEKVYSKSLREMAPYFNRFDWRKYDVVPKVRLQEDPTCWAFAATQAFESSLMIQRAISQDPLLRKDKVVLNVNSTLMRLPEGRTRRQGRYERAFNVYVTDGIPKDEVLLNRLDLRDFEISDKDVEAKQRKQQETVKAVAWDWVFAKPWRTPLTARARRIIKDELLYHGPLVVMVSNDDEGMFNSYGRPREDLKVGDATEARSLRFAAKTVAFKKDKKTGKLFLSLPDEVPNPISDKATGDLILRFPADKAPVLETQKKRNIKLRPTDGDDAVTFNPITRQLGFTVNNAVEIEEDARTDEVVLKFPANTNAQLTTDRDTQDLIIRFPADNAPIFTSNTGNSANHFVLLIGWDDDKCAWIIQNTFSPWGYQCNGPNLHAQDSESETVYDASEDRGYMYIGYGQNQVGQFAAWLEAQFVPWTVSPKDWD